MPGDGPDLDAALGGRGGGEGTHRCSPADDARLGAALRRLKLCASAYGVLTLCVVLARWALRVA